MATPRPVPTPLPVTIDGRVVALAAAGSLAVGALAQDVEFAVLAGGVALLGLAGYVTAERAWPTRALAALPGGLLIAAAPLVDVDQWWARTVVIVLLAAAAVALPDLARRWDGTGAVGLLLAAGAAGVYLCLPETDHLDYLVPAYLVLGVSEAVVRRPLGPGVALAACGLLCWAVLFGGTPRDGALVGGLACLGLLLLEPVARRLPGAGSAFVGRGALSGVVALTVLQVGYCLAVSRTAGLQTDAWVALAIVAVAAIGLLVATRAVLGGLR
jgi:hypothetical protein